MTSVNQDPSSAPAVDIPWYDLLGDPEPPEDSLQQEDTIIQVMSILKSYYDNDPTVLCVSQTYVIYDSSVPGSVVAPDGFIVFGVEATHIRNIRNSYRIEEWGPTPAFVFEVASESTAPRDPGPKRDIYARMGVQEYWRFDWRGHIYGEPLAGERLVEGQYQQFDLYTDPNGDVWSPSDLLGLDFVYRVEDGIGRFLIRESATGEWLNGLTAERAARLQAEQAQAQSEARARKLEAELARLRQQG